MSLPNRVTPFGELVPEPARGLLMGNRGGMFHDPVRRALTGRRWSSPRWLCCSLDYPGSHRHPVWSRGYTQLFFLDEVTALAAGHRPCAECRRTDAFLFLRSVADGLGPNASGPPARLSDLDARLHGERLDGREKRLHPQEASSLPDGAVFEAAGTAFAVRGGRALRWRPGGYGEPGPLPPGTVAALTPPASLAALRAGYKPMWHPTASDRRTSR